MKQHTIIGSLIMLAPLLVAYPAQAQTVTQLDEIHFSGDIDHRLPAPDSSTLASIDDTIAVFNINTGTAIGFNDLDTLDNADLDAFHASVNICGASLYSLDATAEIAGTVMRPADVFNVTGFKVIDAMAEGIPDGVNINAVSRDLESCDLVLSIDIHAELDGTVFAPDDLIAWNSSDGFSLFLATSLGADIDAVHLLDGPNRLLISTDTDTQILDNIFQDHDIIELTTDTGNILSTLSFSPSPFDDSWDPADIDALWAAPTVLSGVFQWEAANIEVLENAGSVDVMIERTNGSQGSIDVQWSTVADSAMDGSDFTGSSDTLTLPDGVTSAMVTVALLDDIDVEGTERFMIRIDSVSDNATIGEIAEVNVIIRDDEDFIFADGFENEQQST